MKPNTIIALATILAIYIVVSLIIQSIAAM